MRICFGTISVLRRTAAIVSTCLVAASLLSACTATTQTPAGTSNPSAPPHGSSSCLSEIRVGPLPDWARAGFSPPGQEVRRVEGIGSQILGVVFADPLRAPAPKGYGNKILWLVPPGATQVTAGVAQQDTSSALRIDATLIGSQVTVRRTVPGGPGPSLIDMPRAGCWRFELAWDGHRDTLVLPYLPP
jgi:hypothetical protein